MAVSVLFCELVSAMAVCLSGFPGHYGFAPHNIFTNRHWLKVFRVHAMTHAAQVVKYQPFWDWAFHQFIKHPVSTVEVAVPCNSPIPVRCDVPSP